MHVTGLVFMLICGISTWAYGLEVCKENKLAVALAQVRLSDDSDEEDVNDEESVTDDALFLARDYFLKRDYRLAQRKLEAVFFVKGCYTNSSGAGDISTPDYVYKYMLMTSYLLNAPSGRVQARMVALRLKNRLGEMAENPQNRDMVMLIDNVLKTVSIQEEPLFRIYQEACNHYQKGTRESDKAALVLLRSAFFSGRASREVSLSVESTLRAAYLRAILELATGGYFNHKAVIDCFHDVAFAARGIDPALEQLAIANIPDFGKAVKPVRLPPYNPL